MRVMEQIKVVLKGTLESLGRAVLQEERLPLAEVGQVMKAFCADPKQLRANATKAKESS